MHFEIKLNDDTLRQEYCLFHNRKIVKVPLSCQSQFRFDFFIFAQAVNYADRSVSRKNTKDGWTRELSISVPVHDINTWAQNKLKWQNILSFLTGDRWSLSFYQNHLINTISSRLLDGRLEAIISLLSGGLDSLIGAIDLLATNNKVFFSNSGEPSLSKILYNNFKTNYDGYTLGYKNHHIHRVLGENTQRARSLLFLANALIDIDDVRLHRYQVTKVIIPENGFIGINVPLSFARLGSASTKTAHPYYLENLELLWKDHGLNIELMNPYQLKTKGEMLVECKNQDLLQKLIPQTMSCAHPKKLIGNKTRYHSGKRLHCAHCWPCLIRRASIKHYQSHNNYEDITSYVDLSITSSGVSQKDWLILQRFLSCGIHSFADINSGSFYIRTPKMKRLSISDIHRLIQHGIDELSQLE